MNQQTFHKTLFAVLYVITNQIFEICSISMTVYKLTNY